MAGSSPPTRPTSIASADEAPRGCIARVEKQSAHRRFLRQQPPVPSVMINFDQAERLYRQNTCLDEYFGRSTTSIISTAVNDSQLSGIDVSREVQVVRGVKPDFHIPGDVPVYRWHNRHVRKNRIIDCLKRTVKIAQRLEGSSTKLLPLVKGVNPEEWSLVSDVFDKLEIEYSVFYAVQYFTNGVGFTQLKEDIEAIVSEIPTTELMTIGLMSPQYVKKLPDPVVATAGLNQWLEQTKLRKVSYAESRRRYDDLATRIESALNSRQAELTEWTAETGVA